ncbi:MAG TPA: hypothetical protein VG937_06280 [Polyangiaceae bacterium]|nr:hypothetical protein [Polyangiaceae bacterium]
MKDSGAGGAAPSILPTEHVFVGSKAPWFTLADDLPQYEEHVGYGHAFTDARYCAGQARLQ